MSQYAKTKLVFFTTFLLLLVFFNIISNCYAVPDQSSQVSLEAQRNIVVHKEAVPYKDIYFPGDEITIIVEIKVLKYRDIPAKIQDLTVYELIDENLVIGDRSDVCAKIVDIKDLKRIRDDPNTINKIDNIYNIYWDSNLGKIEINEMNTFDRLIYWYKVTPKTSGIFSTNTIVRSPYSSDIDQLLSLDVSYSGLYRVDIIPTKNRVYQGEQLNVNYLITYLGRESSNSYIRLAANNESYFRYNTTEDQFVHKYFNRYQSTPILAYIYYTNRGTYPLPGIWIDGFYYASNKEIIVDNIVERHWRLIELIILIGSIFSGVLLFIKYTVELIKTKDKPSSEKDKPSSEKNEDKPSSEKVSLTGILKDVIENIFKTIQDNYLTVTVIVAIFTALYIYNILCILYPFSFISIESFISNNWILIHLLFIIALFFVVIIIWVKNNCSIMVAVTINILLISIILIYIISIINILSWLKTNIPLSI